MGQQQLGGLQHIQRNYSLVLYESAARTATPTAQEFINPAGSGIIVRIKSTAVTATPSVVFTIQGYDEAAGDWYDILASAAIATVTSVILRVHPSLTASANLIAKDMMPVKFKLAAVHGDADSITYSAVGLIVA